MKNAVTFGDGAIRFVTDNTEAGNMDAVPVTNATASIIAIGSPSPYGLWGAIEREMGAEKKLSGASFAYQSRFDQSS